MIDLPFNLRNLLSFPDPVAPAERSDQWQEFQNRLGREIQTIKWPAAMPDLVSKVEELFNAKLPDLLVASWKKTRELQDVLEESKKAPEEVMFLGLAEHVISSEHHPYIEIRINGVPQPKRIQFTVILSATLKGVVLKIKGGTIVEIQMGSCEFDGEVKYEDLTIAEKKLGPIRLQGVSTLEFATVPPPLPLPTPLPPTFDRGKLNR
jgi:hypothetical protein